MVILQVVLKEIEHEAVDWILSWWVTIGVSADYVEILGEPFCSVRGLKFASHGANCSVTLVWFCKVVKS
jgi:hypothetical protein